MNEFYKLKMAEIVKHNTRLRYLWHDSNSIDDIAEKTVNYLYDNLLTLKTEKNPFVLMRFFITSSYRKLSSDLKANIKNYSSSDKIDPDLKCLKLVASRGVKEDWNDIYKSKSHKVIPLDNVETVSKLPMISELITQLGIDLGALRANDMGLLLAQEERSCNLFYVPDALGSKFILSQNEFVIPYKVKTALGFGSVLPNGEFFVIMLFSKIFFSKENAEVLKTLTLSIKYSILRQIHKEIHEKPGNKDTKLENKALIRSKLNVLEKLIAVFEETSLFISTDLEKTNKKLLDTQLKVIHQEKMASIGQLAAGVAHEINNPIGYVLSNLGSLNNYVERLNQFICFQENIIKSFGNKEQTQKVEEKYTDLDIKYIVKDIRSLLKESVSGVDIVRKIVSDLKIFSRSSDNKRMLTDINECIKSTVNIVWNEIKYTATLDVSYGEIPKTMAYSTQLGQVFINLLMNAVQAIRKKGKINIKTWYENNSICISISDNGIGILKENLIKIFEAFYSTKEIGKGTGLGLSISYEIIKNHDGEIFVESEPGAGTRFTICLPVISLEK